MDALERSHMLVMLNEYAMERLLKAETERHIGDARASVGVSPGECRILEEAHREAAEVYARAARELEGGSDFEMREDGAVYAESDRPMRLSLPNGYFYQVCCDCGLVHRIHVIGQSEVVLRFECLDELPEDGPDANLVSSYDDGRPDEEGGSDE